MNELKLILVTNIIAFYYVFMALYMIFGNYQ